MDVVVLAGGFATRLWPLTRDRAKPLLPLGEKPVIDYLISDFFEEERIEKIYLSINKRFKKDFRKYVIRNDYRGIELVIEDSTGEEEKLGALGALNQAIERREPKTPLLVVAGDNYVSFKVSDFLDFFEEKGDGSCLAAYRLSIEEASSFGVLDVEDDEVMDLTEKPSDPESDLISIAYYCFTKKATKKLNKYIREGNNPDAPGYFIQWLIDREKVFAYDFKGKWYDIGTPMSYLGANKAILDENKIIESETDSSSKIRNSFIKESVVEESELNNCIIFEDSKIKECELKNVIVDGTKLVNEKTKNKLIK